MGKWDDPAIRQCAGAAIFRGNICKTPRNPQIERRDADYELVFSWDNEFIEHHTEMYERVQQFRERRTGGYA